MSRCFPFPPPGYEKKDIIDDDADILTKEKHKEKKHKKDKRDKEKKDKEQSKGKRKEKKDRKEKNRDRDKDKEKKRTSDEKKVELPPQNSSAEKFTTSSLVQKNEIEDQKHVQELRKRIRDEEKPTGSQFVHGVTVTKQRRVEVQTNTVENNIVIRTEEVHRADFKKEEIREFNGQYNHFVQTRGLEKNPTVQKFPVMDQKTVAKPMEKKYTGSQMEQKEENKYRESNDKLYKHKGTDRESKNKDKDKDKEKKKKEKGKGKGIGETCKELPKLKPVEKSSLLTCNIKSPLIGQSSANEGNHGKRKQPETNGFLLDNGLKPSKLPRSVSSTQPVENGRKLEQGQAASQSNGSLEAQRPRVSSRNPSSSSARVDENGKACEKPPRPDMKYLGEILTVPKVDLLDLDDEEWLFGSSNSEQSKKPKVESSGVNETQQVWSEALRIESADVVALPYVIPF